MGKFIGRSHELDLLGSLLKKKSASLIVIKGRRRIGKSRLIAHMAQCFHFQNFFPFSGLPPTKDTTAQSQRDAFAVQLAHFLHLPGVKADDWFTLLLLLAERVKQGRTLILFDEISWMGSKDPDFLGKLKTVWDLYFKNNDHLIFVLCGSISVWIEDNILSHTGFVGRITLDMTLKELSLRDSVQFWGTHANPISSYEKFKTLSVTGGIPLYLEHIDPKASADDNITTLCFHSTALLFREFDNIFSDLFSKKSPTYKAILNGLVNGPLTQLEICQKIGLQRSGDIGHYLDDLIQSGFVSRSFSWQLKTGQLSKLSQYRICDNYARFYLKYIEPNRHKIEQQQFAERNASSLPQWNSIMGYQFETLVLNNRQLLWQLLKIAPEEIIIDNPYFQRPSKQHPGCQIDYLIQTKFNTIYVCEIKFSKNAIGKSVMAELQQKITHLPLPKNFSYRPVLIHVNGITEDLEDEQDYFFRIIDFCQLML